MRREPSETEPAICKQQRWERVITLFLFAVIASGVLGFAANDAFFSKRFRARNSRWKCIGNLKAIDAAKARWALEQHQQNGAMPLDTELFGPASGMNKKPTCPSGGTYRIGAVDQKPRCSIPDHTL